MAEITKMVSVNRANSLRTTVPHQVVKSLGLRSGSHVKWTTVQNGGKVSVSIEPV